MVVSETQTTFGLFARIIFYPSVASDECFKLQYQLWIIPVAACLTNLNNGDYFVETLESSLPGYFVGITNYGGPLRPVVGNEIYFCGKVVFLEPLSLLKNFVLFSQLDHPRADLEAVSL